MKKGFVMLMAVITLSACKSNTATKLDNSAERALKGEWRITSVSYPGSEMIKVISFNTADSQCFVGSTWKFISNNNKGEMALIGGGNCPAYSSQITWFINKEGNVVMKFLTEGIKAKHTTAGYVLKVANSNENSFQFVDKINVGGKITDVVYQFQRQ